MTRKRRQVAARESVANAAVHDARASNLERWAEVQALAEGLATQRSTAGETAAVGADDGASEMRRLTIDLEDLVMAMDTGSDETEWHLDRITGVLEMFNTFDDGVSGEVRERVESDPDRYLAVVHVSSPESFRMMREFADGLGQHAEAAALSRAIAGPKPFRRFKDCLSVDTAKRWYAFRDEAFRRIATAWLEEEGIEPEWTWRGQPMAPTDRR